MVASMVTKIVNNLQITIKRLHIRYEDHSFASQPVALGIGIKEVSVRTTNEDWEVAFVAAPPQIHKLGNLSDLFVYEYHDPTSFAEDVNRMKNIFTPDKGEVDITGLGTLLCPWADSLCLALRMLT